MTDDDASAERPPRRLALVTGASRGIGLSIAQHLAPDHDLMLVGRSEETLEAAAATIREAGAVQVSGVVADLADPSDRAGLVELLVALDPPVQVLVNNAGIASSAPLPRTSDELWARSIAINLTAPFELSRALAPAMARRGWGRIITVASTAALKGYAYTAAYSASKAGVLGLTRAMAAELARRGVTVNALCPGFTDTAIVASAVQNIVDKTGRSEEQARASLEAFSPLGRLIAPQEVAAMVAYLASDAAASITGQALAIDGGETTL